MFLPDFSSMEQLSDFNCYKCQSSLDREAVGRRDTCPKCSSDVHVCKNCAFYDLKAYNECREIQAERVVDKEKSNFCDYFKPGGGVQNAGPTKEDLFKNLDSLFKK